MSPDTASKPERAFSPAAERNRAPILAQLQRVLPPQGLLLEIASGSGQHAAYCAAGLPGWQWQPTEREAGPGSAAAASIASWCAAQPNVRPALKLDVTALDVFDKHARWPGVPAPVDAVFCANLIHIAPWAVTPALLRGAASHLRPQGRLCLYGPYFVDGETPAPGNLAFDADLRQRDAAWGVRRLQAVLDTARDVGLHLVERIDLPANNLMLVLARG